MRGRGGREGRASRAQLQDYGENNDAPWRRERGKVITSKPLVVEGAGWQPCEDRRNVQLSSLKHHHSAYQSFPKGVGWSTVLRRTAFADKDPGLPGPLGSSLETKWAIESHAALGGELASPRPGVAPELCERLPRAWLLSAGGLPFQTVPIRQAGLY